MNNGVIIYNASAGTGKTFNLVANYIAMAIKNGNFRDFECILAITFTNAATKEMKDRIIDVLSNIDNDNNKAYLEAIKQNYYSLYNQKITDNEIIERSKNLLSSIIHNYSFFNISTIDSFFQVVLKNIAKELSIDGGFNLVLDDTKYIDNAVKDIMDNEDNRLWLNKFFLQRQQEGKSWNLQKELGKFAKDALKNDTIKSILYNEEKSKLLNKENLKQVAHQLKAKSTWFENEINKRKKEFFDTCLKFHLTEDKFYGGKTQGVYRKISTIPNKLSADLLKRCIDRYNNGKDFLSSGNCPQEITKTIFAINDLLENHYSKYFIYQLYLRCIYQLGLIKEIYDRRNELRKEDGAFLLSDTSDVLKKLNQGDVPFVFEKISQRVDNIMVDEFQDTNSSANENLNKLMQEAMDNGGKAYIFGDLKQSIYRWNGGDWSIMQEYLEDKSNKEITLNTNRRSFGNIISFTNEIFSSLYSYLGINFMPQNSDKKPNEGLIRVKFTEQSDEMFDLLKKEIDYYHDELKYNYSDILVLFRSNSDLINCAERLKDCAEEYNPISDKAFKYSSSVAVCRIISALRYLDNKTLNIKKEIIYLDDQTLAGIDELSNNYKKEKSLLELVLSLAFILKIDDDAVFLPAFYDELREYTKQRRGNIEEFLIYWDEQLADKSLDTSNISEGLPVMSIHKSKGLERKVVIVPYCNWKLYKSEQMWIENRDENIQLPLFTAGSSALKDTIYSDIYEEEKKSQYIDNINMLYVALTRAKENLSIISYYKQPKNKTSEISDVGSILYSHVTIENKNNFSDKGDCLFIYKNAEAVSVNENESQQKKDNSEIKIKKISLNNNKIDFAVGKEEDIEDYFLDNYGEITKRERGTILHSYISRIKNYEDLNKILTLIEKEDEDSDKIKNIFLNMFDQSAKYHWFDNTYKILNEQNILCFNSISGIEERRPDRIMYNNEEVIVVDYKFGKQKNEYIEQVKEYIELLKQMKQFENKAFKGYLWYINTDKQEENHIDEVYNSKKLFKTK